MQYELPSGQNREGVMKTKRKTSCFPTVYIKGYLHVKKFENYPVPIMESTN